ncbi:hypothetical protein B2G69_25130 [Methylorubrum zatmanii]|nr:hypothetical protein B2G69_25130 [Methylorubrum zatmanii]
MTAPGDRPHARSEITIGPLTTFARKTPEEVVRAPCVERGPPQCGHRDGRTPGTHHRGLPSHRRCAA